MSWRYQATKRTVAGEEMYEVREVYPDVEVEGEKHTLWTESAMAPYGESKPELVRVLRMMLADVLRFPVLDLDKEQS